MARNKIKFTTPSETEYDRYETVIDVTMGEFAFSDFYPLHSASYATCMGVIVGAVDRYGVALAHLDPMSDYGTNGRFYSNTLSHMIDRVMGKTSATKVDICVFKDGFGAFKAYDLDFWLKVRYEDAICHIYDGTDHQGTKYDEVIAMPSTFYSAYACLKIQGGDDWDALSGKKVLQGENANVLAKQLGRARELTFVSDKKPLVIETG